MSNIPFAGTPKQEAALIAELKKLRGIKGALMIALQKAQDIYEYLPVEVQTVISEYLDVPLEEVYGVSTFYSQFALAPKGKYRVGVCLGTACYVKGGGDIFDRFKQVLKIGDKETTADGVFTLEATRCLGCCGLAPVLTVNDEVHGRLTVDDVEKIVARYSAK
jgi:NADP-reducing hydrogenase subunit HndA